MHRRKCLFGNELSLYIHRVREKNGPPKQNAVKCTVY